MSVARGVVERAGLAWWAVGPAAVPKSASKPGPAAVSQPAPNSVPFPDMLADHRAAGDILWAPRAGAVRGFEDGTFRPSEPLTRADGVVMIRRAVEWVVREIQRALDANG
ncbi:S-layer homology domain-containing protein [Thermaerobacter composti]|uniref:S-layer homology domain-containing protein n=1 Tax=Thermaerobacter composti TaxID=554949 RepID=A0ABZ0QUF9_9FIRM|nr:S-layer homology domain-containing protein [Thermaerobacter composti]WPD20165.1 S-layer homology domain-containing protein [Thermaerobacter composti]